MDSIQTVVLRSSWAASSYCSRAFIAAFFIRVRADKLIAKRFDGGRQLWLRRLCVEKRK
jgi:hypothetical protein